jgi:glucose/arabinose dehydrogenase/uncharacterized cupredoxin-like copper-binding protein
MNNLRIRLREVVILLFCIGCLSCKHKVEFDPAKGSHIVIMGNTFADRMQHYAYFEAMLQNNFPDRNLIIRNLGWSADEAYLQPRPLNFGTMNEHLADQKADIIFLCFGMNESFKGKDSLDVFKSTLDKYCQELATNRFNGKTAPQLILVSPIAHENIGGDYPDGIQHNQDIEMYTTAMKEVAEKNKIGFIDLYAPSSREMKKTRLTINGIHLNDTGYALASKWMGDAMGLNTGGDLSSLKKISELRDQEFFYKWRAVNGEYIYGRRQKPFGVISYPPEMQKLTEIVSSLDSLTWKMAADPGNSEKYATQSIEVVEQNKKPLAREQAVDNSYPASASQFTLPKGYAINLFASEKDFPVEKPVSMSFDSKGRLWVATMPTYPQYYPGVPPSDKIVVLEDTDGDGKADKHTVFADGLYLPLGFIFGDSGVYVAEEPNILFLKDTDGDGKADKKEIVLQGFGSEDSHHASHAFTWGQDGAFYFHEGTFLNSQVETPYGPVRAYNGTTFRYQPRSGKLSKYISYPYNNPWGNVFNNWGMHLIGDASDGKNYYATPMTVNIDYMHQHPDVDMFTETKVRPTAGIELVSSRHFPDEAQGNFLVNNTIGFQGIKQHKIFYEGSGVRGKEVENLLQSNDPNFRPVDLKFGPDGALYVADWFNPLIGHMQFSMRDPGRDKAHGRIWRITYPSRPLLKQPDISKQTISQLLDNVKVYEDRFRYRSREQLRIQDPKKVISELDKWVAALDKTDSAYEHNLLEALWIYQDFDIVKEDLLKQLLGAKDFRARAAATRVLFYWRDRIPQALNMLADRVKDDSSRVRIEAVVALSFFKNDTALNAVAAVLDKPVDYYLQYATMETIKYLRPFGKGNGAVVAGNWLDSMQKINDIKTAEAIARTEGGKKNVIEISTLRAKMMFDKSELVLPANQTVTVRFNNPDEMPHNFVIIRNGSLQKVGKAANEMIKLKDGFKKGFVPAIPEVLFSTPLVDPGKSYDLKFVTPPAGNYLFICSFPGHWSMMNGKLKVVSK